MKMIKRFHKHHWQDAHFIRRLEWDTISYWLKPRKDELIYDLGCGEGFYAYKLAKKGCKVYGLDLDKKAISSALTYFKHQNNKFTLGNAENTPYKSNFFDKAFSVCVLEHIKNDQKALKEAYRVLKKNGILVLSVDSSSYGSTPEIKKLDQIRYSTLRFYIIKDLKKKLEKANFKVEKMKFILNSPISTSFYRIAMKLDFRIPFTLMFPFSYPLSKISDKLFGKKDRGIILIAKARK